MPAVSKKQKTLACIALSMHQGKTPKSYSKQAAKMSMSMSESEMKKMCKMPMEK